MQPAEIEAGLAYVKAAVLVHYAARACVELLSYSGVFYLFCHIVKAKILFYVIPKFILRGVRMEGRCRRSFKVEFKINL